MSNTAKSMSGEAQKELLERLKSRRQGVETRPCARYRVKNPDDYGYASCSTCGWAEPEHIIEELTAQLAASQGVSAPAVEWQPIETAPKDGTWILVQLSPYSSSFPHRAVTHWHDYGITHDWYGVGNAKPIYWMRLAALRGET